MDQLLKQFVADLNSDPNPDHIRKNEDGSLYIPISITQTLLDEIFLGQWGFEVTDSSYGRKWARVEIVRSWADHNGPSLIGHI